MTIVIRGWKGQDIISGLSDLRGNIRLRPAQVFIGAWYPTRKVTEQLDYDSYLISI